jgi:glyoxylase-like metal-dependent hydrolase (beta-lactamase superfamily II)/rhodanese-related sulfurtransferase
MDMNIQQLYTKCLAQGAYYIESNGEAAVIDPLRDISEYLDLANKSGAKIKYIFETHFHADFVSGHLELHNATGAPIVYGPSAQPDFDCVVASDGQLFSIGNLTIETVHTPGHTMESTCWLLLDDQKNPHSLFSGDTLFIGDVGRPDLAQKTGSITMEDLAGMLYESLQNKILPLPDAVVVYPGHGAGSACGKNMSSETMDLLGNQKKVNYALKATSKDQFIKEVTTGLVAPPAYFPENVALNKKGYDLMEKVMNNAMRWILPAEFTELQMRNEALVLDTRSPQQFKDGFLKGSVNIGIKGDFAPWVGTIIENIKTPLILVANEGEEKEVITRLSRVGYEHILGFIKPDLTDWKSAGLAIDQIKSISATELEEILCQGVQNVMDVRKQGEYNNGHVVNAHFASLQFLSQHEDLFKMVGINYVHCQGGYRSMIACSLLKRRGIENVVDIAGGYAAISKTSILTEVSSCQTA